ncbi:hypothetical protein QQF64_007581 [Cirrhinus molitorella]|uniref:Ig-like domain-containing protein n=1 Tax=Cirrhinus molitorella TaxID=172907 RepID=A0ABR3MDC9_9TELE
MMLIFGLMLLQTAACLELNCCFNQKHQICYAALGHKLNLQMMLDANEYDLKLIKIINNNRNDLVCRVRNDRMRECDLYKNRTEVTVINGTVMINHVIRADSGNYKLRLVDSDGTETSRDLQVIVEAPIGSVNVSISCSSNQSSVFCSSEGDQITYNWILNGEILENETMVRNTIHLNEGTVGNISCSVKNHVSHSQKTIRVKPCPEPTSPAVTSSLTSTVTISTQTSVYGATTAHDTQRPECVCSVSVVFVLVWCFQLMVLLGLLGGFHIYMRHTSGKKQEDQQE